MPPAFPLDSLRAGRTRAAIVDAFTALSITQRYDSIRVSDVILGAGVGKSTFYEHFRSKDDVLLAAMWPILLALATAASGRAPRRYVREIVAHLWDRRSSGRLILGSRAGPLLQRHLAEAIRRHAVRRGFDEASASFVAIGTAAAQWEMLRYWLTGHSPSPIDAMTDRLLACSRLLDPEGR